MQENKRNEEYQLGIEGEEYAAEYLRRQGYIIRDQRWHDHHMELDIVAVDVEAGCLVSVEVKTRRTNIWGEPEQAIDFKKIMRTVRATDYYMKKYRIDMGVRFDIIAIVWPKGKDPIVNHLKDAFYPPLG